MSDGFYTTHEQGVIIHTFSNPTDSAMDEWFFATESGCPRPLD